MLPFRRKVKIETERMTLRLPTHGDWNQWAALRDESAAFLMPCLLYTSDAADE